MDSAGSKSVMSNDMKELQQGKEATMSQIRGHKANLSNPSEFSIQSNIDMPFNSAITDRMTPRYQQGV
jgi:hypothetical protein